MFIRATGIISPQHSFGHTPFLTSMVEHRGEAMRCIEPDYSQLLDPKLIRRMSRIIRFGTAAAMDCIKETGWENLDGIITGTAYGCLEDTRNFLSKMIENNEQLLTPTAFIQSTHNTLGAQIGLSLRSHCYNNTFVHRAFSFENALTDAQMLFAEGAAKKILVGAADEIIPESHDILRRFGLYRNTSNTDLYKENMPGTMAGEGAAFFALTPYSNGNDYAEIIGLKTYLLEPGVSLPEIEIQNFLGKYNIEPTQIDLVLAGKNGDVTHDLPFQNLEKGLFNGVPVVGFKQFCGEYPTASGFGLWMAACICKNKSLPPAVQGWESHSPRHVLVFNGDMLGHCSLILISAC